MYKDLITTFIAVFSFLLGGILVYWRENRKQFQEKIFEFKFNSYKEIFEEIGMYYQDVFSFLEYFQFYEKTKEEWLEESNDYFKEYYQKAFALQRLYYKNIGLLPEKQLEKLQKLLGACISHVTVHHHFGTSAPHDSYDRLYELFILFVEDSRKELSYLLKIQEKN